MERAFNAIKKTVCSIFSILYREFCKRVKHIHTIPKDIMNTIASCTEQRIIA